MDPTRLPERMFRSGLFDGSKKVNAYCNLSWIGTITSTSVLSEDHLRKLNEGAVSLQEPLLIMQICSCFFCKTFFSSGWIPYDQYFLVLVDTSCSLVWWSYAFKGLEEYLSGAFVSLQLHTFHELHGPHSNVI